MNEIKVGSEWTNHKGTKFKVLFVGGSSALCQWDNGREFNAPLGHLGDIYKEVPFRRTVWLNVHRNFVQCHKDKKIADKHALPGFLYQQEVELIDPCEGV